MFRLQQERPYRTCLCVSDVLSDSRKARKHAVCLTEHFYNIMTKIHGRDQIVSAVISHHKNVTLIITSCLLKCTCGQKCILVAVVFPPPSLNLQFALCNFNFSVSLKEL